MTAVSSVPRPRRWMSVAPAPGHLNPPVSRGRAAPRPTVRAILMRKGSVVPLTITRENRTARWLVELATDRLSDDELEALIPMFLAGESTAPEELIRNTLAGALRQPVLLRSA